MALPPATAQAPAVQVKLACAVAEAEDKNTALRAQVQQDHDGQVALPNTALAAATR